MSFFKALRIWVYSLAYTNVPMPSLLKTSAKSPSSTSPLMMCTRGTPASQAATAWRALEIRLIGQFDGIRLSICLSSPTMICRINCPSRVSPSTVVRKISLVALSCSARAKAMVSELTR